MTTALATLGIVAICLIAMVVWLANIVVRGPSPSSTPPSPTPPTTPIPPSDTLATQMVTTMAETMRETISEMRGMVVDMTQGRSQQPTTTPEMQPMSNGNSLVFDYDSTPLPPGIEAVIEREETETEQGRLLRERDELQRALRLKQEEMLHFTSQDSSSEPWMTSPQPDPPTGA